jgi:hypothetical protein
MPSKSPSDELSPAERLYFELRRVFSNERDLDVVEKLLTAGPDSQMIDALAPGSPEPLSVNIALVYLNAALARHGDIATKNQIRWAEQALSSLKRAHDRLLRIVPPGSNTLAAALGDIAKDLKGLDEPNEFSGVCSEILARGLAGAIFTLQAALDHEAAKPRRVGERRKRLRSLVEALAAWWNTSRGEKPAITPELQRTSKRRVLVGLQGEFLDLARAVFCRLDNFNDSEVTATVQDVLRKPS